MECESAKGFWSWFAQFIMITMSIKSIYRSFDGTIPFHLTFVPTEATGKNLFGGGTKSVNGFPTSNDMTSSILQCLNQMKKT